MSLCLNENELTRLYVSDQGEMPAERAHLAGCAACAASYEELARDSRMIAGAIAAAASNGATAREFPAARRGDEAARHGFARPGIAVRLIGTTAFGAAAAIAAVALLGWRPSAPVRVASVPRAAMAHGRLVAYAPERPYRMMSDPISAIAYDEAGSAATRSGDVAFANYGGGGDYGDLLFCAPGEENEMCATSADHR